MTRTSAQQAPTPGAIALGRRLLNEEEVFVGPATIKKGKSNEVNWLLGLGVAEEGKRGHLVLRSEEALERALTDSSR